MEEIRPIRVVHYGLGSTGKEIARMVSETPDMRVVGGIDQDPELVGRDLGEVLELSSNLGIKITPNATEVLNATHPDIVVLATTSKLDDAYPQILACLRARANVISTCEELVYPYVGENANLAERLEENARRSGVTVLGVGINPGFVMDMLPLILTGPCSCVQNIRVERVIDATVRRSSLHQRIGAGLTLAQFRSHIADPRMRHVGLPESLHMIAHAIGWKVERCEEHIEPIVTDEWIKAGHIVVAPGQIAGIQQTAVGFVDGYEAITLDWKTFVGAQETYDSIKIDGTPPITINIPGGLHGHLAAASMILHTIRLVVAARSGLLTVMDIPPIHYTVPAVSMCRI